MQRKTADAESSFRQAVAAVERVPHKQDEKAECLYQLAHVLAMEEKTDESIEYYSQSLHVLEEAYGTRSPKLVTTLYRLGAGYKEKGDLDSAKKLYKLAFEISLNEPTPESLKEQASLNASHRVLDGFSRPEQGLQTDNENSEKNLLVNSQRLMSEKTPSLPNSKLLSTSPSAGSLEPQQEL